MQGASAICSEQPEFTRVRIRTPFLLDFNAPAGQNGEVKIQLTLIALMSALPVMAGGVTAEPAVSAEQADHSPESVVAEPAAVTATESPAAAPAAESEAPAVLVESVPEIPAAEEQSAAPVEEQPVVPAEEVPAVEETPVEQCSLAVEAPVAEPAPPAAEEPVPASEAVPAEKPTPEEPTPTPEQPTPAPAAEPAPAAAEPPASAYRGIVKVDVVTRVPDYETPWQGGSYGRGTGTGFLVAPGLFMTNAHVVANAEKVDISLFNDARRIPARVKFVAHDADLAMLEIDDTSAFEGVPCLEFSEEMPLLEDTVRAIGYPIGGNRLSVTRGIVSRIDTIPYAHPRNIAHLALQVDAAINPGNSGGPVFKGDKVIGVAFQGLLQANSTGYVIPLPVIRHFLRDIEDGRYDGYVEMGARFMPMENKAMRRHYDLPDNGLGCLVADVVRGAACDGPLQVGDVVLAVNGLPVDSTAMIELEGVRVRLEELAERAFAGDKMYFTILRNGEVKETEAAMAPLPSIRVLSRRYDEQPRYVVFGGLVFQPLNFNVVNEHQVPSADVMVELDRFTRGGESAVKEDLVLLTSTLPDEVNARLKDHGRSIVTRVNGVEVKGLAHLNSLLYPADDQPRPEYTIIELADAARPLVIENAGVDAANARIAERYNIPAPARLK